MINEREAGNVRDSDNDRMDRRHHLRGHVVISSMDHDLQDR